MPSSNEDHLIMPLVGPSPKPLGSPNRAELSPAPGPKQMPLIGQQKSDWVEHSIMITCPV